MLVLTRKPGEQIIIAGDIKITVVSIGNGRVKIGVEAPSSVKIDRQEIHDRKAAEVAEPVATVEPVTDADTPTTILHNRIAVKLPAPKVGPPQLENRLKALDRRLPRKPR